MADPEHPLSPGGRRAALERMRSAELDLLVIGGGITGAGVARDAALRGMRVGLVERSDFASGTSSRSSKIVHGGVRYLEYLQFGLVRESAVERGVLRRIAPHLVHPLPFLYPVYEGESLLRIRAGLRLFDLFAGPERSAWSRALSPEETRRHLPGLRDPLKGAVLYPEFITDDARLTLANVASAAEHGALVANHAPAEGLLREGGRVVGARVRDALDAGDGGDHGERGAQGERGDRGGFEVRAEVTVMALGPWAEAGLAASGIHPPKPLVPSKGIHILFERARLPLRAATFLRSRAGRRGLAMPRGPWVYVGTSDDEYRGPLDRPRAEPAEVDELLEMTRDCFPALGLEAGDVKATWAGVRPLILEKGKSTRDTSRHDEVWIPTPGLVVVAGGKLTTYRRMGARILGRVGEARGRRIAGPDRTARERLPGAPREEIESFRSRVRAELLRVGVDEATRERLEFLYGTEIEELLSYGRLDPRWWDPLADGVPAVRGEVRLAVERGMALTLADTMDRRLALLVFAREGGVAGAPEAASIMAGLLGWDARRKDREVAEYRALVSEHGPRGIPRSGQPAPARD